jgi:hypothetical protein
VLGDVGHPQAIGFVAVELAVDVIAGGHDPGNFPVAGPPAQALEPGPAHQHLHGLMPDGDPVSEGQLGVHASGPVDASGIKVDPLDDLGHERVAD